MKNLKKVLALVLVFASLFGLAATASATKSDDYSDAASISHVEAVDVMSTIGVFDGISGAFSGGSILTREQAAKIITYMVLGKEEADKLVASVAPYTDVARDRWSAGSIAYCKNEGILAGVGNGRFEPNGKLTGVAFAKMCLVALGYDPNVEKLTGPEWAVNTSKLAIAGAKITGSLSQASLADEMSREDACQMAFNTLQATMVDYESRGSSIVINDITINTGSSKAKPVATETNWAGIKDSYNNDNDGIQQFAEKYFSKLKKVGGEDSFGRPSNEWTYKSEKIGTYVRNNLLVKSWTAKVSKGELYNTVGSTVANDLKKNPGKLISYADGCYLTGPDAQVKVSWDDYFAKNSSKSAGKASDDLVVNAESGNGVLTELYMDDNGEVWISMINTYLVQANADYNSTKESVSVDRISISDEDADVIFLPPEISNDDFDVTGVKEGDYLLLNVSNINGKNCDIEAVTYATVQKGTVTEYTDETNVVMDGTKYSYNKILSGDPIKTKFAINSEATLVLDAYGYIMHVDDSVDSSKYVYIRKFGSTSTVSSKAVADAYFTDGTNAEISVSEVDGTKNQETISGYGEQEEYVGWHTFTGSTGGQYKLTPVEADPDSEKNPKQYKDETANNGQDVLKSAVKFMSKGDWDGDKRPDVEEENLTKNVKGDDKTIFVVKSDDGVTAYTGISNVPTVSLSASGDKTVKVAWVEAKNAYAKYVFIDVSADEDATIDEGTSVADYMFVLKAGSKTTHVDGVDYRTYTVVIDGKTEERWVEENAVQAGRFYFSVKEDDKGRIKDAKEVGKKGDNKRKFMATMLETKSERGTYLAKNDGYSSSEDTEIKRSGSSLYISALKTPYEIDSSKPVSDKSDLVTNAKSSINLVIAGKKSCIDAGLLKDDGADYEAYVNTNLNQVTGLLGDNGLKGRVYLVTTEDDGSVVDTLWIYVEEVYEK